MEIGR